MTTISDKDRAAAQAMFGAFLGDPAFAVLSDDVVPWWLAVRDHVLAAHTCPDAEGDDYPEPACLIHDTSGEDVRGWEMAECACADVESDPRIRAWLAIAAHPFFAACYQTEGTLVDAMVAKLDAHTPEPEPWPDEVVESLVKTLSVGQDPIAVLDALAALRPGVRAAITGGEQS